MKTVKKNIQIVKSYGQNKFVSYIMAIFLLLFLLLPLVGSEKGGEGSISIAEPKGEMEGIVGGSEVPEPPPPPLPHHGLAPLLAYPLPPTPCLPSCLPPSLRSSPP